MRTSETASRSGRNAGRCCAICSWMRPSKRRPGRLRKTRSALWVTAVPSSSVPVWFVSRQVVRLAPRLAGECAQPLTVALDEDLVGIEEHEPVAGRRVEGDVARVAERAGPLEVDERGAELECDLARAVLGAGVDDDELVDGVADGRQAARQHLLLVLDDHAEAQRQALGGLRCGRDALAARSEVAHRRADRGRQRRRLQTRAAARLELIEVVRDVREVRVEAAGGAEQALGGRRAHPARRTRRPRGSGSSARVARPRAARRTGGPRPPSRRRAQGGRRARRADRPRAGPGAPGGGGGRRRSRRRAGRGRSTRGRHAR